MAQTTIQLTDEVQEQVRLAKTELGEMLAGQGNIVRRIGDALRKDPSIAENPERICVTIKQLLVVEVEQDIISHRTIEDACPPEWKNQVQSRAGAKGAAKTAANAREKNSDGGESSSTELASAIEDLKKKLEGVSERLNNFKAAGAPLVRAGKPDGDYVIIRATRAEYMAFVEAVEG